MGVCLENLKMSKILDGTRKQALIDNARAAARGRAHDCLHPDASDPVQRMVMALEPETCVTPHRHPGEDRWELLTLLEGRLLLLRFDDRGVVRERIELTTHGTRLVEFDGAGWHALVSERPGTLVLEVKRGPWRPPGDADFAAWAPREGAPGAAAFRERLRKAQVGDCVASGRG